jgi:hypothetical protein
MKNKKFGLIIATTIAFFAIALMIIPSVSAYDLSFDNYKTFIPANEINTHLSQKASICPKGQICKQLPEQQVYKYGVYEIWDKSNFFWEDDVQLADYRLIDNSEQCLINCYAEGTVILYADSKLFDGIDIKDVKGNSKSIDYKIYYYIDEDYSYNVTDYENICDDKIINETIMNVCNSKEIGQHEEINIKTIKKEYNGEILSAGDYTWSIEGKKGIAESIDWIGVSGGQSMDNWAWWNSSWIYSKPISILETSGINQTNIQVLLNITYNSNMNNTFLDLRFVNSTNNGELSYWIENYTTGDNALVWIKLPSLTAYENKTIYMYYGVVGNINTTSNGVNTFEYFDNFNDNSLGSGWTTSGSGSLTESGGQLNCNEIGTASTSFNCYNNLKTFGVNNFILTKFTNLYVCNDCSGSYGSDYQFGFTGVTTSDKQYWGGNPTLAYRGGDYNPPSILWIGVDETGSQSTPTLYPANKRVLIAKTNLTDGYGFVNANITSGIYNANSTYNSAARYYFNIREKNYGGFEGGYVKISIDYLAIGNYTYPIPIVNFGAETTVEGVVTSLFYPQNNYNTISSNVNFNWTITPTTSTINNWTFYLWYNNGILNQSQFQSESSNITINRNISKILSDGSYIWNVQGCGIGISLTDYCSFDINRTLMIDTTVPNIFLNSGNETYAYSGQPPIETFNYTIYDSHLSNCWYEYNNINITLSCFSGISNITTFIVSPGIYNATIYANDTLGNINSLSFNWNYKFFQNEINYNNITYETSLENFSLNFTSITSLISASALFYYNNTLHSSITNCDGLNCISTISFNIPLISSGIQQNNSFYWIVTAYDGTNSYVFTTPQNIQTVNQLTLSACTSGTIALNFTSYDEQNKTRISPYQFDGTFDYYSGTGATYKELNISTSIDEVDLCINKNITYYLNSIIAYSSTNTTETYSTRNWFYQNYPINNIIQSVPLYLLKSSASTSFILQVQDANYQAVKGVLIEAQRCYPGSNTIETVFKSRTDANGMTVGNLEAEIALYQFIITNNSQTLLAIIPCAKVVPQTAPYTLIFQISGEYISPFINVNNLTDIASNLSVNHQSNILTWTYTDTSGNFSIAQLVVQNQNLSGSTTPTICDNNNNLSSGIIICNISNAGTYTAYGYITRTNVIATDQTTFNIETFSSMVGFYGVFLGFFLILISCFMFKYSEIAGIWAIVIVCLLCNIIGLIAFGTVFITAIILIGILITVILER